MRLVYLSPVPVASPEEIEARVPHFLERAGFYFGNWDRLYDDWLVKIRDLVKEMTELDVSPLPEMEDMEVITSGADDTAGLVLSDIAPLVDRVYVVITVDQIPALEAAVSAAGEDTDFVAELTGHSPDVTGSCLILAD